jgi:hypothetical protein
MLEGARNLVAGRRYVVVEATPQGDPAGRHFLRLERAIEQVVTRTIATDPTRPGWQVMKVERGRAPEVVWPTPFGDDGDGENSMVPRRPLRPAGSGAIALPLPEAPHTAS